MTQRDAFISRWGGLFQGQAEFEEFCASVDLLLSGWAREQFHNCDRRAVSQYDGHPEDPYANGYVACLVEMGVRSPSVAASVEEALSLRMGEFYASLCKTCRGTGTIHSFRNGMSVTRLCPDCNQIDRVDEPPDEVCG